MNKGVSTSGSSRAAIFIIDDPGEINVDSKYKHQIVSAEADVFFFFFFIQVWTMTVNPLWFLRLCVFPANTCAAHDYSYCLQKHASVVKWKLMECKVECKCGCRKDGRGGESSQKKPVQVACTDRTWSVFCIPSLPCCLGRNRRPRSGRADWGWYNSHWITQALIYPLGFSATMG